MKKNQIAHLLAVLFLAGIGHAAAGSAATVTVAVNQVTHGSASSANSAPAKVGTQLSDGEYLKTGAASRAEMELSNQTITRLGANTIFNYSATTNTVDLQAGTILFSKPKDAKQMNIKTAAVTAAIVGTTGFVQKQPGGGFLFGLVEGSSTVTIGGVDYTVHGGEVLLFTPPGTPQIFAFDVPRFLKSSGFFTKFHGHLPNEKYIDEEVADYNDLVDRGFITPPKDPFYIYDPNGNVPTVPVVGTDSAGNALNNFNTPPPMPKDDCCFYIPSGSGSGFSLSSVHGQ